ncbi:hypothetical protein ACJJTC_014183 [Scirpophaga incertulas]
MTILQGILRSILLYVSNVPNVTCCKMLYNKVRGASGDACGSVANRMLYVQQFTPGASIAHMSKCYFRRDKNEDFTEIIRSHQVVALEEDNISDINIRSMQVTESPLPIDFNESEINELAKLIDDDIFESPKITCDYEISNINSTASIPSTSHPSPDCSIKHLDNDCSNHFCPYYIGKENELPFEAATYNNSPAFQSESPTPMIAHSLNL